MSSATSFLESVREAFRPTDRGVVGLVDNLLQLCSTQGLEADWHADLCRVRTVAVEPEESIDLTIPRSVIRAALARFGLFATSISPVRSRPTEGMES